MGWSLTYKTILKPVALSIFEGIPKQCTHNKNGREKILRMKTQVYYIQVYQVYYSELVFDLPAV